MSNELRSLLARVEDKDPDTAKELRRHIDVLQSRRQFGLNFERHMPESVALTGRPISVGDKVRFLPPRGEPEAESDATWLVTDISGTKSKRVARLIDPRTEAEASRLVEDLVYVADFRDPIYPGLKRSGEPVLRGGDKPFHTVVNAENYHALEALLFTYQGKVDCIYIDPPYNSGARDWKYNNDYVDGEDAYRHSKWLAMMERRLKLAKRLLKPDNSVLIVTIDEKEYLRLGLLLQQTFPEAVQQMISSVINPAGTGRQNEFSRTNEFIYLLKFGDVTISPMSPEDATAVPVEWEPFRRRDLTSRRGTPKGGRAQFYAIFVDRESHRVVGTSEPIPPEVDRHTVVPPDGCAAVFPVRKDGTEMNWSLTREAFKRRLAQGYARVGKHQPKGQQEFVITYLRTGPIADIESGRAVVVGKGKDGSVVARYPEGKQRMPLTQWAFASHDAQRYGTTLMQSFIPGRRFPYPKSLYAVEDALRIAVAEKPDAIILDFFAGSGTTAHAVMRLNKQDGGRRRSISVTNNEVSADEHKGLIKKKLRAGDPDWEALGICEHITKPRLRAAVTGLTPDSEPIKGDYRFTSEFPMSDGFEENVEFFTLTYENPALVELDLAFERIAPLLWMRAGSEGRRIDHRSDTFEVVDTYAVLFNVDASKPFLAAVEKAEGLRIAYIVTDDEIQYQAVAGQLPEGVESLRLYETYLRTFQINTGRV